MTFELKKITFETITKKTAHHGSHKIVNLLITLAISVFEISFILLEWTRY